MRNLILFRHAKSSWIDAPNDKNRPLENSGILDARVISREISDFLPKNYTIYSSAAARAHQTAQIFTEALGIHHDEINLNEDLYTFNSNEVEQFVKKLNPAIETALLFGHNPAFTEFANTFGDRFFDNLPTAGLIWIVFKENNWNEIQKGTIKMFLYPKAYK
jgi:phosphohistidine phosphatase